MQTRVKDNQEDAMLIVAELKIEKMEEVIVPISMLRNHNETLASDEVELDVEELEEVIAPKLAANHNETLISDEVALSVEELEEVIAPGVRLGNHNETLVADVTEV